MKFPYKLAGALGVGLIILFFLVASSFEPERVFVNIEKANGSILQISAEIADSPEERMIGLMNRESLERDSGMLFFFEDEEYRTFWMKNTLIPLDIVYIAGDGSIVDIAYAVPCEADPCPVYPSSAPAMYVLEVNAGYTAENGFGIGDKVNIG